MNIGIDTLGCEHGHSGYGSYLLSFVAGLKTNSSLSWTLFGQEIDRYTYDKDTKFKYIGVDVKDTPKNIAQWHKMKANGFYKKQGFDAVLYPASAIMTPPKTKASAICVVNGIVGDKKITHALKKAPLVIAASKYVKEDLVKKGLNSSKITVIYDGIDKSLFYPIPQQNEESVNMSPFAIKKPYFIYASKLQDPSKKHIELIQAFSIFKKRTKLPHRLVLAGAESDYTPEIHKAVFVSEFASDIFLTGFFPHENMADLYRGADACLFPASSEGAGLPLLEAMACGVLVACSNHGVLREITGGNALFFDSNDTEQMADVMEKIVQGEREEKDLVQKGQEWAKQFSWEKTAEDTCNLIEEKFFDKTEKEK